MATQSDTSSVWLMSSAGKGYTGCVCETQQNYYDCPTALSKICLLTFHIFLLVKKMYRLDL